MICSKTSSCDEKSRNMGVSVDLRVKSKPNAFDRFRNATSTPAKGSCTSGKFCYGHADRVTSGDLSHCSLNIKHTITLPLPAARIAAQASLGIRRSPLGDRATVPTFGPSGRQDRLNCWAKNRRTEMSAATSGSLAVLILAVEGPLRQPMDFVRSIPETQHIIQDKNHEVRMGPPDLLSSVQISPSSGGSSSGLTGVSSTSYSTTSAVLYPSASSAAYFTRCRTSVFGTDALTPYMDIWSPL